MPGRGLLEDIHAEPLPEFHHPLLMAGWAEVAALVPLRRDFRFASTQMPRGIRVCLSGYARSLCISHGQNRCADRPRIRYGAGCIEIAINNLLDIRPPESILP